MMKKTSLAVLLCIACLSFLGAEARNPNWYRVAYCIDHGNVSGCASDANDGNICGCAGGGSRHGPLKNWSELYVNRWGCGAGGTCPRFATGNGFANATISILSSDVDETMDFAWSTGPGVTGVLINCILGTSNTVFTGTLSSFTAGLTGSGRSGVSSGVFASGLNQAAIGTTLAYNELIFDTTHASYFWPYYDVTTSGAAPGSGDVWAFSQPLLGVVPTTFPAAEVVIASGDTVTVYQPPTILLNKAHDYVYATVGGNSPAPNTFIRNCTIGNNVADSVNANNGISFVEDAIVSNLQIVPGSNGISVLDNISAPHAGVDFNNSTAGFGGQQNYVLGGLFGEPTTGAQNTLACGGCQVDGDTIFGQTPGLYPGSINNFWGQIYLDRAEGILVYPGSNLYLLQSLYNANQPVLWGNGSLGILPNGVVVYKNGAGKAAATFLQKSGTLFWVGNTTTTTGYQNFTTPVVATPANLDTAFGATIGCLQQTSGAVLCN